MTEHQWKELSKYLLDNGNQKLSTEEKGIIKLAIDQADSLNELSAIFSIIETISVIEIFCYQRINHKIIDTEYDTTYNMSRKYLKCRSGINY